MRITRWKILLWLGWTSFATGGSFLLLTVGFAAYEASFLLRSVKTAAVVIANLESYDTSGAVYCPQFQYQGAAGQTYTSTSGACASPAVFQVGEKVTVRYLRSSPAHAQTDTVGAKWGLTIGFGLAAVVSTPIGLAIFRTLKKRGQPLNPKSFWK
jgi:hypothetical protein